jgi:site-specific DNA-methyltransferase (adenine-specific)
MTTIEKYQLIQGDCLEWMDVIPAGSVDAIIADLPYQTTSCAWDVMIPFAPLWAHFKRVLKERGAVVLFGGQPFTSALVMSNPGWFRVEWIWKKPMGTNYLNANRDPMKAHENILVFCDGYPTYNPQKIEGKGYRAIRGAVGDFIRDKSVGGWVTSNDGERYPLTVQEFNQVFQPVHPTQKPLPLLEYLVKTYTNPGDTVLDCTMGSGTTGAACGRLGRRFIGIEKDEAYFEIAVNRIKNAYGDYVRTPAEIERGQLALFEVKK